MTEQPSGVIYKICCCDCDFVYYGQTDRALKTRIREHERAVSQFDQYSKVAKHAEQTIELTSAMPPLSTRQRTIANVCSYRGLVFPQGS